MEKKYIRKQIIEERKALSKEFVERASSDICRQIKSMVGKEASIFIYIPMDNEVQTGELFSFYEKISVPKCYKGGYMEAVTDYTDLEQTSFGTMEPTDGQPCDDIDVVIVPGVAFSREMDRIGYGAGYYDRFLSKYPNVRKIAVCFDFQLRDDFLPDNHDVKMDLIVTEKRVLEKKKI